MPCADWNAERAIELFLSLVSGMDGERCRALLEDRMPGVHGLRGHLRMFHGSGIIRAPTTGCPWGVVGV
ncbi:hypothetical protein ACFW9B_26845, partial [Streptomyces yangpuensis]